MGRRGYVQVRSPKYGSAITDWVQDSLYSYLTDNGLEIKTDDDCCPEDADHWEIDIPWVPHGAQSVRDLEKIRGLVADLRAHPEKVAGDDNDAHGEIAASLLEEGLATAVREGTSVIVIDWF